MAVFPGSAFCSNIGDDDDFEMIQLAYRVHYLQCDLLGILFCFNLSFWNQHYDIAS